MLLVVALAVIALFVGVMVALYFWARKVELEDLPPAAERQLSDEERRALQLGIGLTQGGSAGSAPF